MNESRMIRSVHELAEWISEWGFLPLFRNDIEGFSVEEHTPQELWFADGVDGPWEWKGPAIWQTEGNFKDVSPSRIVLSLVGLLLSMVSKLISLWTAMKSQSIIKSLSKSD